MFGIVCVFGEYQNEDAARIDPAQNSFGPIGTERDVARSNPTANAGRLKVIANRICDRPVLTGVADKDLRCHGSTTTAEGGSQCRRHRIPRLIGYLCTMAFFIVQVGFALFFVPGSFVGAVTKRLVC